MSRKSTRPGWKRFNIPSVSVGPPLEENGPMRVTVWAKHPGVKAHLIEVDCNDFRETRVGEPIFEHMRPAGTCGSSRKITWVGRPILDPEFGDRCAHCTKLPKAGA
jgi:hypothetical protein